MIGKSQKVNAIPRDFHPGVFDVFVQEAVFEDGEIGSRTVLDIGGKSQSDGAASAEAGDIGGVLSSGSEGFAGILPFCQAIGACLIGGHPVRPDREAGVTAVDGRGTRLSSGGWVWACDCLTCKSKKRGCGRGLHVEQQCTLSPGMPRRQGREWSGDAPAEESSTRCD